MADEKIKLGLDLGDSSQKAKELASSLGGVKVAAQGVADTYEVLAVAGQGYELVADDFERMIDQEIVSAGRATAVNRSLASSKDAVATASSKAAKATKGFGTEMLTAGRIAQDFAQGGFGGILNNIEGLLVKFPALAGAATAVGVALYVGGPIVKQWWQQWQDGSNEIPNIVEGLDKITAAIKTNKEWIDKVSEKGYLTDDEVTEFKARVAEMAQGEKDLTEAKKARAAAEALAAVQTKEASESAAEASRVLKEELAGQTDDVITSVEGRLTAKSSELKAAAKEFDRVYKEYSQALEGVTDVAQINDINASYTAQLDKLTKIQGEIKGRIASDAANLVSEAVLKGNQEAIDKLAQLGGQFADAFRTGGKAARAQRIKEAEEDAAEMVKIIEDQEAAIQKKYTDAMDNWAEGFAEKLKGLNDQVRKQIEDADAANAADPNAQGVGIIRDVESQDFYRTDKYGREVDGLGMTSKQAEDAAKAAREFQRTARENGGGLTDREAAQLAIMEQQMLNQQAMSNRINQANNRQQAILNQSQAVPSILDWGMGW